MFTIASDYCGVVVLCPSVAMSLKIFKKHKISTLTKHEYRINCYGLGPKIIVVHE